MWCLIEFFNKVGSTFDHGDGCVSVTLIIGVKNDEIWAFSFEPKNDVQYKGISNKYFYHFVSYLVLKEAIWVANSINITKRQVYVRLRQMKTKY